VVIADCDRDSAEAHAAALAEAGHHAVAVSVDLADEASIIAASATIAEDFGAPWLLVNNAALQDREFLL
jgi:NAD(P)-dependent dehydrogenase (short-subunit alcohol dehydrogenase family)